MAQSLDSSAGIPSEPVTSVAARVARRTSLWRDLVTWTLIVLTYLSLVLTVLCLWTRGFLFNTDRFVGVVAPIIRNGGVADALSIRASEQIVSALQIQQRAESALPERASFLAGPLAKAPTDTVADRLDDLLRNNRFACVWEEALRIVHSQLIVVLRDRSNALRLNGDTVRLSLFPVIDYGFGVVEEVGLLPDRLPRPDLANVTPEQGRQLLSSVFGVQLPPDVGEVTVAESESLHNAQQWVRIFRIVTVVALPLLMLALAGAAI